MLLDTHIAALLLEINSDWNEYATAHCGLVSSVHRLEGDRTPLLVNGRERGSDWLPLSSQNHNGNTELVEPRQWLGRHKVVEFLPRSSPAGSFDRRNTIRRSCQTHNSLMVRPDVPWEHQVVKWKKNWSYGIVILSIFSQFRINYPNSFMLPVFLSNYLLDTNAIQVFWKI